MLSRIHCFLDLIFFHSEFIKHSVNIYVIIIFVYHLLKVKKSKFARPSFCTKITNILSQMVFSHKWGYASCLRVVKNCYCTGFTHLVFLLMWDVKNESWIEIWRKRPSIKISKQKQNDGIYFNIKINFYALYDHLWKNMSLSR